MYRPAERVSCRAKRGKNMINLKPCPFCGGKAVMISEPYTHDRFLVACKNRGEVCKCEPCTNWFDTPEEAAEVWNRRENERP